MEEYMANISNNSVRKRDWILANSYQIGTFSPEDFKDITGGIIATIAKTSSGKTVLLKDILSKIHKNYKKIYLMSRTAKLQADYDYFPRSMITDDYDEELMTDIWNNQIKRKHEGKKLENILVILDDVIASKSFMKSKMLNECAFGARHVKITIILLSQYFVSIAPKIRENIRIAIAFQMSNKKEREKFVRQFLSADTDRAGEILFRKITDVKFQSIVIQDYKNGQGINDKVKSYIADPDINLVLEEPEENIIKEPELIRPKIIKVPKIINKDMVSMGSKYGI